MMTDKIGSKIPSLLAMVAMLTLAGCNTGPSLHDGSPPQDPNREVYRMSRVVDEMNQNAQRDRMVAADMNQRMAMLEGEIRQLRGTVDELRHENSRLRDQASSAAPVPPPITSVSGPANVPPSVPPGAPSAPSPAAAASAASHADSTAPVRIVVDSKGVATPPPATQPTPPTATQPALSTKLTPPNTPPPAASSSAPPPASPVAAVPATANKENLSPEKSYDEAFVLLKSGQYDKAMPAFEAFVKQHPQHDLADNSQYWIGEMHYVQRRFPEALVAFNKVLVDWPNSDKVPASLLKIGFSFYELEDNANAKSSLERLVKEYPDNSAVTPAKQRLKLIHQKQANP
ncbi:MAG: tol-pal system protein YbgF [Magnetococcales bacterium]|nr:tol-pal system protein YbgF [Magnetococcales bacterium]NGZ28774.1 tol-pal system protein YbgF [Magnetococcales bacterium]